MTYKSDDSLLGLQVISGGKKPDRRVYFLWGLPDSAPDYPTEAAARAALQEKESKT
jgi:hypothetical protein